MMNFNIPLIMVRCLFFTILIECVVGLCVGIRNKKDFLNILLVNFITNPIVVTVPIYFNIKYGIFERRIVLLTLELVTLLVEGYIYNKVLTFRKINPFLLSIILNVSSYLIGEIINGIIY